MTWTTDRNGAIATFVTGGACFVVGMLTMAFLSTKIPSDGAANTNNVTPCEIILDADEIEILESGGTVTECNQIITYEQ